MLIKTITYLFSFKIKNYIKIALALLLQAPP